MENLIEKEAWRERQRFLIAPFKHLDQLSLKIYLRVFNHCFFVKASLYWVFCPLQLKSSSIVCTTIIHPSLVAGELSETSHISLLAQGLAHSRHSINVLLSQGLSFLICQMETLNCVLSFLSGGGDPEGEVWTVLY